MGTGPFVYGGVEDKEDVAAFGHVLAECFPMSFEAKPAIPWPWFENPDHFRLLRREGRIAAGLVAVPVAQWFGGKAVPMWAIRLVGVGLEFRSLGAGPVLMGTLLREAHREGVALSALYPATQPLYRSVGYEQAGFNHLLAMPLAAARLRDHALQLRRFDVDQGIEVLQPIYRERARRLSGHVERSDWFWKRILQPRNLPQAHVFLAEGTDGPEGYMVYAMPAAGSGPALHGYDVFMTDFVAVSAAAARRLVAHLGEHHSMGRTVRWRGSFEAPEFVGLPQQQIRVEDGIRWMLRLVDVRRALEQRGFAPQAHGRLELEVRDGLIPDNDGCWTLTVEDGTSRVDAGGAGALRLDVRGLAALYAGYLTPFELCLAGLAEGSDAALATAAHLFAGPRPWMPDFF